MAVAPSGRDPSAVYTSQSLVERYLPSGAIAGTADTVRANGKVIVSDLTDIIRRCSRKLDGALTPKGFEVPFPDISATNPRPPDLAIEIVTWDVVGEVRTILQHGNRQKQSVRYYLDLAKETLDDLLANPLKIGRGRVSTPELLTKTASTDQYGKMVSPYYRVANRNIIADSLRFVNAAGAEVCRPDGLPFMYGSDYSIENQAQGLLWLYNEAQILAQTGTGGGVVYEFSWRKLDWGQTGTETVQGVSRL